MSYILDALRKSDQQRHHGAAPTLASVQFSAPEARQRKYFWLAAVAGVLFLAGILIGWWRPWQPAPAQAVAPATAPAEENAAVRPLAAATPQPPAPAVAEPVTAASPERIAVGQAPKPAVVLPPVPPADVPSATAPVVAPPPLAPAPAPLDAPRADKAKAGVAGRPAEPPAAEKRAVTEARAAVEQRVMSRSELPGSIQQELPRFNVSLHAYSSTPSNRLVSVNDQLLHEGDSLSPGLVLEQIRPEDMVFAYKGFRFRQGLQ